MAELPYTDRDRRILAAWKREMQTLPDPMLARKISAEEWRRRLNRGANPGKGKRDV